MLPRMQISPVTPQQVQTIGSSFGSALVPAPAAPAAPIAAPSVRSAAGSAAVAGAALVTTPLIDFPGIAKGDVFDIAKGSKVGMFSPKGTASIDRFEPDAASFHLLASTFGVKVDMLVTVERVDDKQVRLTTLTADGKTGSVLGNIVATRQNYAEFVSADEKAERTIIRHDGKGGVTIDTVVPTFGAAHLVLQKHVAVADAAV